MTCILGNLNFTEISIHYQLQKTKESNLQVKQAETKKSIQIEAFKEINRAITEFSNAIGNVNTTAMMLPENLELHRSNPQVFEFNTIQQGFGIGNHILEFMNGHTQFVYAMESYEVAILEFRHLSAYISMIADDTIEPLKQLEDFIYNTDVVDLVSNKNQDLKDQCSKISNAINNITFYLWDFRIELMNHFLGDIFQAKVPRRKPRDPKYKILTEVAIKEEVEEELERREMEAMKDTVPE